MRIVTQEGMEVQDPDLSLGYLEPGKLLVEHHEAVEPVPAEYKDVLTEEYENGGKLYTRTVVKEAVPGSEAWDEYEDVQYYVPYTEEQLQSIEEEKQHELEEQQRIEQQLQEQLAKEEAEKIEQKKQSRALQTVLASTLSLVDFTSMTSSKCCAMSPYFEPWNDRSVQYKKGYPFYTVSEDGTYRYFRCSQDVTSSSIYKPGDVGTESLYYEIFIAPDGIMIWHDVAGEYNSYDVGDECHFPDENGPVYRSKVNDNAYSPDVVPNNWELTDSL